MTKSKKKQHIQLKQQSTKGKKQLKKPSSDQYFNRELSWLAFNDRVLHEAADERTPLLERVNFLAISTSNLDEFIMKRVGLLKHQLEAGLPSRGVDRMTPRQQLSAIRKKLLDFHAAQSRIFNKSILPALVHEGIRIVKFKDLKDEARTEAIEFFRRRVFPVLTPLSVDPGHPFPFISNLSTSLGIALRNPNTGEKVFSRIKVPVVLSQFIRIGKESSKGNATLISLVDLIRHNLPDLFPGMNVLGVMPFRITRNADVERDEDDGEDFIDQMEAEVRQRRFEPVVRLEHAPNPDPWMVNLLIQELEISDEDVYEMPFHQDFTTFRVIADLPRPDLKNEHWFPLTPKALAEDDIDIFTAIRKSDLLVHHPYESFNSSIEKFVAAAADDPHVLAIKITLYRTGKESPFIASLIRAAEAGKQVVAVIELKARFDEERNIQIAQTLEKVGVHVVYGLIGLKTHTKVTLVVRNEHDEVRCYSHIGTGNYNPQTGKLYTDLSFFTCRPELSLDLTQLFNVLTGSSLNQSYAKLLVAPVNMRQKFLEMIHREVAHQKAGKPARIVAKMNAMEDPVIIQALYAASQAGVSIDLLVRGFCRLKPGVPGLSDNIRVTSVIGRFLEHSRIFYFAAGRKKPQRGEFFIGSADWMSRNLLGRIEVITPIEDSASRARLWQILSIMLNDQRQAWDLKSDGKYIQRMPAKNLHDARSRGTHRALMALTKGVPLEDSSPEDFRNSKKKKKN